MADDGLILKVGEALARRLRKAARRVGESVEDYAHHLLETGADDVSDWDEIDRICDETIARDDGVRLEDVRPWLNSWGQAERPPRPR